MWCYIYTHRGIKGKISMNKCVNCELIIHFVQDLISDRSSAMR